MEELLLLQGGYNKISYYELLHVFDVAGYYGLTARCICTGYVLRIH